MAILPRLSEEAKFYIDRYMHNAIKRNEIAPLEYIMAHLKLSHVVAVVSSN